MAEETKKYLDLTGLGTLVEETKKVISAGDTKALQDAKSYADGLADNYEAAGAVNTAKSELKTEIDKKLDKTEAESTYAKSEDVDELSELVGSFEDAGISKAQAAEFGDNVIETLAHILGIKHGSSLVKVGLPDIERVIGDASQLIPLTPASGGQPDITKVILKIDSAEKALAADVGAVSGLNTTAKTVVGAINEALTAIGTGGTASVVTVEAAGSASEGAAKTYNIKQGGEVVGTIDIPKDMVVTSGEVVTDPQGQDKGTYIKLGIANVDDPLYINVGKLVDLYTAKGEAAQVQVVVDNDTREISASIVEGSITSKELAANAVITAKIADANVTKEKLSTEVQTSLGKADAAAPQSALDTANEKISALETNVGSGTVDSRIATAKGEANKYTDEKVAAAVAAIDTISESEIKALFA